MHFRRAKVRAKGKAKEEKVVKEEMAANQEKEEHEADRRESHPLAGALSARVSTGPQNALTTP